MSHPLNRYQDYEREANQDAYEYEKRQYERDNWRRIPSEEHLNHMMIHYYAWLKGDTTDDHLGHFFCRAMMLYAVGKAEEKEKQNG